MREARGKGIGAAAGRAIVVPPQAVEGAKPRGAARAEVQRRVVGREAAGGERQDAAEGHAGAEA